MYILTLIDVQFNDAIKREKLNKITFLVMLNKIVYAVLIFWLGFPPAYGKFIFQPRINSDHLIPARIISNYLGKYFIKKNIFVSIYSTATFVDEHQKQQDLITTLTQSLNAMKFSFEIATEPTDQEFKFRSAFNLLLVDDSEAFR